MIDIERIFREGVPAKGAFLSRIFGIFSEEIVRIWARDPRSPYQIHASRPTLYEGNRGYTLDFLLEKDGGFFVSEMKCEVQYQNYKFFRLVDPGQLEHHKNKRAFELFLKLAADANSVPVAAGDRVQVKGAILVWGAATEAGKCATCDTYGFGDILTVESCISDLIEWKNAEYLELLGEREGWLSSLFIGLRGTDT